MASKRVRLQVAAAIPESRNSLESDPEAAAWPSWVEPAWHLYMRGIAVWSQLARRYGVSDHTVKSQVLKFHEAIRGSLEIPPGEALERYLGGLQEVQEQAWIDHAEAGKNINMRTGCLRTVLDALEKQAAALGVVTKRNAEELTGKNGSSLGFSLADLVKDDDSRSLLIRYAARVCPVNGDAADLGNDAD